MYLEIPQPPFDMGHFGNFVWQTNPWELSRFEIMKFCRVLNLVERYFGSMHEEYSPCRKLSEEIGEELKQAEYTRVLKVFQKLDFLCLFSRRSV